MTGTPVRVLFLCTGNSARSIIAEALLNRLGAGRWRGYSAGSRPVGSVNAFALEVLRRHGYETRGLRSKSWDEFAGAHSPAMDLVVTVCDQAARDPCPVWPAHAGTAHWGLPDPAAEAGDDDAKRRAFARTLETLTARIRALVAPPLPSREPDALKHRLAAISAHFGQPAPDQPPPGLAGAPTAPRRGRS